jgi:hypothetical protein
MRREIAAIQALKCIMMSGFWRPWKMGSRERKFFSFQNCWFRGSARRKRRLRNGEVGGLSEVDEGERRGCLEGKLGRGILVTRSTDYKTRHSVKGIRFEHSPGHFGGDLPKG